MLSSSGLTKSNFKQPVLLAFLILIAYSLFSVVLLQRSASSLLQETSLAALLMLSSKKVKGPCVQSIYLVYGLPRSFKSLVLPSLVQNVLIPNAAYHTAITTFIIIISNKTMQSAMDVEVGSIPMKYSTAVARRQGQRPARRARVREVVRAKKE